MAIEILGTCDDRFADVKKAFTANFEKSPELGAAVAVMHEGELVVDLWGGHQDVARKRPWGPDTLVNVASTSKVVCSIAALMLVDRGLVELDEPIATYWPEFAANGKEAITVRQLFCHSTGVAGLDPPRSAEDLVDLVACAARLAAQAPWWEPGTQAGYHSLTYGILWGELMRRTAGRTGAEFIREEVCEPIGADFHIGPAVEHADRIAEREITEFREVDPESMTYRAGGWYFDAYRDAMSDPAGPHELPTGANPSGSGVGNARSLAKIASIVANRGVADGKRLLSEEIIELAGQEQMYSPDLVMSAPVRWGLGFSLQSKEFPIPLPRVLHWGGYGGSSIMMDPASRTGWCYVPNYMDPEEFADRRAIRITAAMVASIHGLT